MLPPSPARNPLLLPLFSICRVGINEQSALRELRERIFYHHEELTVIFKKYDSENTGMCELLETVMHLLTFSEK